MLRAQVTHIMMMIDRYKITIIINIIIMMIY